MHRTFQVAGGLLVMRRYFAGICGAATLSVATLGAQGLATPPDAKFEVISIKPSNPDSSNPLAGMPRLMPSPNGRFSATNVPLHIVGVLFKRKLRGVNADHDQSAIPVFFGPGADIGKRAQPVDARVGPEIDEDDFSSQSRRGQGR